MNKQSRQILLVTWYLGFCFLATLLLQVLFFSSSPTYIYHSPIHLGYSYPVIIPVLTILLVSVYICATVFWSNPFILNFSIWLACLLLFYCLRFAEFSVASSIEVIISILAVHVFVFFAHTSELLSLRYKTFRIFPAFAYLALTAALFSFSRIVQLVHFNNTLHPIHNAYFSGLLQKRNTLNHCKPLRDSIYGNKNVKTLIIVLDAYPIASEYMDLADAPSRLHKYLKTNASEYKESTTVFPYTPYSLAFLLAGTVPNPLCTYPLMDGSRHIRLAFSSSYFKTSDSICDSSADYFTDNLRFFLLKPVFWFNRRLRKIAVDDYLKQKHKNCSMANISSMPKLTHWMQSRSANSNSLDVVHELYFHNQHLGISSNEIRKLDQDYVAYLDQLLLNLSRAPYLYDQIIVMSDHGPRRANLYKDVRHPNRSSRGFDDHYATFFAVFPINNVKNPPKPVPNPTGLIYIPSPTGNPLRVTSGS